LGQHAPEAGQAPPPCFAGYLYSRVFVDGRVFFCCEHIEVGHVDQAPFGEIWTSPAYDAVRRRLHLGEAYPGCARCGKHDMNFTAARQLARLQSDGTTP
jgi:MoaA/NifB/PqqE/SkfB family radical SAM enzyme